MTTANTRESLAENLDMIGGYAAEAGRELPPDFEVCLYYNIHVCEDREKGLDEVAAYLRDYYGVDYDREFLER